MPRSRDCSGLFSRLCASLCTQILNDPLIDERVSGVPVEPELHSPIYLRNVSDGMRSHLTLLGLRASCLRSSSMFPPSFLGHMKKL